MNCTCTTLSGRETVSSFPSIDDVSLVEVEEFNNWDGSLRCMGGDDCTPLFEIGIGSKDPKVTIVTFAVAVSSLESSLIFFSFSR